MAKCDKPYDELASFLWSTPKPELFFTEVEIDESRVYEILLYDFNKPRFSNVKSWKFSSVNSMETTYIRYTSKLFKGFDKMHVPLSLEPMYEFAMPLMCFERAYERAKDRKKLRKDEPVDVRMSFKRLTRQKMVILKLKYIEMKKINGGKKDDIQRDGK